MSDRSASWELPVSLAKCACAQICTKTTRIRINQKITVTLDTISILVQSAGRIRMKFTNKHHNWFFMTVSHSHSQVTSLCLMSKSEDNFTLGKYSFQTLSKKYLVKLVSNNLALTDNLNQDKLTGFLPPASEGSGKVIFSVCLHLRERGTPILLMGEGVTPSQVRTGGYPIPRFGGGYPSQVWMEGTPIPGQDYMG